MTLPNRFYSLESVSEELLGSLESVKHPVPEQRMLKWPLLKTVPLDPFFQILQSDGSMGSGFLWVIQEKFGLSISWWSGAFYQK